MYRTSVAPSIMPRTLVEQELELVAPDVKVAIHDEDDFGLIENKYLDKPVTLDFPVWPGARPGYLYALHWDGATQAEKKAIQDNEQPGDPLTLDIPVSLLVAGTHTLQYAAINPESLIKNESHIFPVIIDKTPAGDPELSAILFPPEIQDGLTLAELTKLGGQLVGQVAGYTGMAKHDTVQTYWGARSGPTATVTETDMGLDRVAVTFDRAFLDSVGEGENQVTYKVIDRAGNPSIDSNPVTVTLKLKEIPDNLPAPIIDPAVMPLIDYAEAQAGVQVDIPHYPGAQAYDLIQLFWGDNNSLVPVQLPPGNEDEAIVLTLKVPFEALNQNPDGDVEVFFTVSRLGELEGGLSA